MRTPRRHGPTLLLAAGAMALLAPLAACGTSGSDDEGAETTTTAAATTTSGTEGSDDRSPGAGEPGEVIDATWDGTASELRGRDGEQFTFVCPSAGEESRVWGTGVYTDDSSVCTAAVQVGLITFDEGGEATIEIAPGLDGYEGGIANDVESLPYGAWGGSFTFPEVEEGSVEFAVGRASWRITAQEDDPAVGDEATLACSPDGELGRLWGTGTYTADSSICTAAVHAGLITVEEGGEVAYEITDGAEEYEGTEANGVTSNSYGSYGTSFTFSDDQP